MLTLHRFFKEKSRPLTRSQNRLLEYILSHDEESIFLNIGELADKVGVSEATVVRLAKALGFKGFPEFQKELRNHFRDKLTTTSRLQKTAKKVMNEGDVLAKVLQADIHNIEKTLNQTPAMEFKQFVKAIDSAPRVILIGLRSAYSLAIFFGIALEFLQKNVWVIQPGIGDMWDRLLGLEKSDLVIGISFPRYTKQTVDVLRFAKERGNRTLAITDTLVSPLARHADHVLTARYQMDSFVESFTAPLSLINAIVTSLGIYRRKSTMKSLKELEKVWEEQQIYYPAPR